MGEPMSVWGQEIYGKSLPPSEFCCKPETALRKRSLKKKKKELEQKSLGTLRNAAEMGGIGQQDRDWSNYHGLDFQFSQGGKSFSRLNTFSLGAKTGEFDWPCHSGAMLIPIFKSCIPPFIHSTHVIDWAPTSARGESSEGSQGLGKYVCRGVSCNF